MTALEGDQFAEFFRTLHGYDPFPWQRRLTTQILETGVWPDVLDIPTGLGKTSAIDIALFALAARPKIAPRRIVLVVDRRVVVDQAADHAIKIRDWLTSASDGALLRVAKALRETWDAPDDRPPFEVAVLRGGMPRDEAWAQRPDRPVVALSTVDQVGSRLLFRGYGVSPGMAPIHAGLLGHDTLILLDEVQLSTAFAESLRAIRERWRPWREGDGADLGAEIPNRWAFVRMSATPIGGADSDDHFELDEADLAHPVVTQRRNASKLATLKDPIATSKNNAERTMAAIVDAFGSAANEHLGRGARRIAVIVNRVATARNVHAELKKRTRDHADVVLLTGRMRPVDRDTIFGDASHPTSVAGRVMAGGRRDPEQRPIIIVSTQTIEAGADFDFDAIVTECASLDALRQRFGRLDRRGELGESHASILIRKDQATDSTDDPIYGAALAKTWEWLESEADAGRTVDFGIASLTLPDEATLAGLCSTVEHAPVLLPAHIDAWAQTNPRGEPDPDVALWLHGPQRGTPEVRVVWRADINSDQLNDSALQEELAAYASASLAVAPPSSLEAISVPLPAFRAWIARESDVELADVEGAGTSLSEQPDERDNERRASRAFLIATQSGAIVGRKPSAARPEATLVVPASYGGIRDGNWDPDATEPVSDLGDQAQLAHRGRPVLRLVPELMGELPETLARSVPSIPKQDDPEFKPRDAIRAWLEEAREAGPDWWRGVAAELLAVKSKLRVIQLGDSEYFAAVGPRLTRQRLDTLRRGADVTSDIVNDDDDSASHIGVEVGLEQHLGDVERWMKRFAANLHLPSAIAADLALAGRLHDIGKADPRFQQLLHGGSPVRLAASTQLLAKSRADARDRASREQARQRSGYPAKYRHELLSVAMVERNPDALKKAHDADLVLHLVGSHHGWCRPFAPAADHGPTMNVELSFDGTRFVADAAHGLATLDSGLADRYWRLTERYGWWTLAWFEALVRLADHRASEESSRAEPGPSTSKNAGGR